MLSRYSCGRSVFVVVVKRVIIRSFVIGGRGVTERSGVIGIGDGGVVVAGVIAGVVVILWIRKRRGSFEGCESC